MTAFLIVGVCFCTALILFLTFLKINKKYKQQHMLYADEMERKIDLHKKQLRYRNKCLGIYDFLKYNLAAALVAQNEIVL